MISEASPEGTIKAALVVKLLADTRKMSQQVRTRSTKIRPADRAWLALAVGVAAYEVLAREGEMLSHSYDRWLINHPVLTWSATIVTAAHLLNLLPSQMDPYQWGFLIMGKHDI